MTSRRQRERGLRTTTGAFLAAVAELFALCGVAFALPIFDVFGRAPEVFIEERATRADLWWFAAVVAFAPPLILAVAELVVGAIGGSALQQRAHLGLVGGLGALIAVRALRLATGLEGAPLLALAVTAGALLVLLRIRSAGLRQWLTFGAFAPTLFAATFLFTSPAHSLAQPPDERTATAVNVVDATEPRPPVVLLVLDELPVRSLLDADGNIDAERFPGFAAFARESTWFRNTTSVATHTSNAVPAILTGQYPSRASAEPIAADHPDNLFRLLGNAYRLNVSELDSQLCAVPRCSVDHPDNAPTIAVRITDDTTSRPSDRRESSAPSALGALLRRARTEFPDMVALHDIEALPEVQPDELVAVSTTAATTTTQPGPVELGSVPPTTVARAFDLLSVVQPTRFANWLDRIDRDTEHPALNMLHITMPHNPWHLDSAGNSYRFPDDNLHLVGVDLGHWTSDPGAAISAYQRHLLQLRYVDTLVSALQSRLEELEIWDDAVVIVTADHGAGFDAGGWFREWDPTSQTSQLGVPLLVHGAEFKPGTIDDRPVQSVDIVPTIAELADIEAPWKLDGVSLTALPTEPRTAHPIVATKLFEDQLINVTVTGHLEALLASATANGSSGGDDLAILRSGPSGSLIGAAVATQVVTVTSGGSVEIEYPTERDFAPNENGEVSALIVGDLDDGGANQTVVVSVDGRIGATSLTFADGDHDARFAALLPPPWMTGGAHDVQFFVLNDDGSLAPLDVD